MMEAASTFETSASFYQTTWRNVPEDSHLHTCRRENLETCRFHLDSVYFSVLMKDITIYNDEIITFVVSVISRVSKQQARVFNDILYHTGLFY
jgi:hypothetical protein